MAAHANRRPMDPNAKLDFGSLAKVFSYGKKYMPAIIVSFVLAIAGAVLTIFTPYKTREITDIIVDGLLTPAGVNMDMLMSEGVVLITVLVSALVASFLQHLITSEVTHRLSRRLRSEIGQKINRLPLSYFDTNSVGDTLSRITNDVDTISQTLGTSYAEFLSSLALFIGVTVMMFVVNYILAFTTIISAIVGFIGVSIVLKNSQRFFRQRQKCLGEMNGNIEEIYSNHKIVKAFTAEKIAKEKFNKINGELRRNNRMAQFFSGTMGPIMAFSGNLSYVMVFVVGVSLALGGDYGVTFGVIMSFTFYARLFSQPLSTFAQALSSLQQASAASTRVFEMLETKELEDESHKETKVPEIRGDVTFDHVNFSYDSSREIIHDFTAELKAGSKVAIVGPTGAGKTTMVNLLMRFYEVNKGSIKIDGVPTTEYTREQIHDMFDMILQDTWLFNGTIRENLCFKKTGVSDEKLNEVCKAVGLDHYIRALPNGFDSPLDDVASLSEGQKQQLTIARAMIKDSPMLILDEATSSVDTRTEIKIQQAMDELTKGRTSFVIAHRLSTIKNADIILVMKDGDIVETGTHKGLLAQGGFYAELYNSQFQNNE